MKETKKLEWFHKTVETLAVRQNVHRDKVLEAVLTHKYEDADKFMKELQTISVGIQLCQQSILRENDRIAAEAKMAGEAEKAELEKKDKADLKAVSNE